MTTNGKLLHTVLNAKPAANSCDHDEPQPKKAALQSHEMTDDERCRWIRRKYFPQLRDDIAHTNHGSFGVVPTPIREAMMKHSLEWQSACDHLHYNYVVLEKMKKSVNAVGPIINSETPYTDHICLVDNATTGANIVAHSLMWKFVNGEFKRGDCFIMWECAYGSIQFVFRHYLERLGVKFIKVPLPFPLDHLTGEQANQALLDAFKTGLDAAKGAPIRMVLLEQTASQIALSFPVKELAELCRSYPNVGLIYCDAAHALGNDEIDVQSLDVDIYVSNCHKWFFNPHSCAVFYSKLPFEHEKMKDLDLHHPIVSWQWNQGILRECYWTGTRDNSSRVVLPEIIQFLPVLAREMNLVQGNVNPKEALRAIQKHNHKKVREDAKMLADAWKGGYGGPPEIMFSMYMVREDAKMLADAWKGGYGGPPELMSSMCMVGYPPELDVDTEDKAEALRLVLLNDYKISTVPYSLPCDATQPDGSVKRIRRGFTRISHQVYVTKADVEQYRDAVLDLLKKGWKAQV